MIVPFAKMDKPKIERTFEGSPTFEHILANK